MLAAFCRSTGYATAAPYMNLTLEVYRDIVRYVGSRADIASLCRVSKAFQNVSERALYNTLYMRGIDVTMTLCVTLASNPHLAEFVDALTIVFPDACQDSESEDDDESHDGWSQATAPEVPPDYWPLVSRALQATTSLRFLNIHVNDYRQRGVAWILNDCSFRLQHFHCDLDWDTHLVGFLDTQTDVNDLYLIDYNELPRSDSGSHTHNHAHDGTPTSGPEPLSTISSSNNTEAGDPAVAPTTGTQEKLVLNPSSLPALATLECTFSEAAVALLPGRPITRLKTCFSSSTLPQKRAEMALLFSKIKLSSRPLCSLDLSDSEYSESFSMELLRMVVQTSATTKNLRYLGTLVLPIMGKQRLLFYALLMRLPRISCVELDVSEWEPPPTSPPAYRALAAELHLYNPSVKRVIFVHEYERTAVKVTPEGICKVEPDANYEFVWREV